jgi:hypothetical protein
VDETLTQNHYVVRQAALIQDLGNVYTTVYISNMEMNDIYYYLIYITNCSVLSEAPALLAMILHSEKMPLCYPIRVMLPHNVLDIQVKLLVQFF